MVGKSNILKYIYYDSGNDHLRAGMVWLMEDFREMQHSDGDDDLYIIGAVCLYPVSCDEKVTSSLIWSATVAGEIYI